MQIYKKLFVILVVSFSAVFSQEIEFPEMPGMPQMPTMGDSFYKPNVPYFPNREKTKQTNENVQESNANKQTPVLSDATTPTDAINSFLSESNILSALDINSLYDAGLFDDISSLKTASKFSDDNATNEVLNQILDELKDLKKKQNQYSQAEKKYLTDIQEDSHTFKDREPTILRFRINGYNLNDSLVSTFFSEPESNGSFLLTADRKYVANKKQRTETFYMLFKAVNSNSGVTTFEVIPSIAQDFENKNSFIYKMCEQKKIKAEKTGNLVVVHLENKDFKMDMLLDVDN